MNYSQSSIPINSSVQSPLRDLTPLEYIFIGHNIQQEIDDNCSTSFNKLTGDFDQAQELIDSIIDQHLSFPDSIIIDVPLNLTASATLEIEGKIHDAGMQDYITKPFNPDNLFLKIRNLIP